MSTAGRHHPRSPVSRSHFAFINRPVGLSIHELYRNSCGRLAATARERNLPEFTNLRGSNKPDNPGIFLWIGPRALITSRSPRQTITGVFNATAAASFRTWERSGIPRRSEPFGASIATRNSGDTSRGPPRSSRDSSP